MCPWEAKGLKCGGFSLTESWQSFIGWALAIQEEEVFLLSVGLSCHLWEFCLLVSQLYFSGSFSILIFAVLPIDQDLSLKTSQIKNQIFQFQQFLPSPPVQEGPFLGVVSHVKWKCTVCKHNEVTFAKQGGVKEITLRHFLSKVHVINIIDISDHLKHCATIRSLAGKFSTHLIWIRKENHLLKIYIRS